ncbi:DNA primase [Flavobacteriaceae bacterium]|nr:DNA primase [Flavobacteriaceae bacterium]MDB4179666.1 DNA primase [Flavobacteriaceae bacterium]MDC0497007.1 DNA primase [Flavobacteriaceae bacterium]
MISKSTIDKVFESSRVEEVIGDFVQLKKSGSNFKGLSPFSEERTPSFMVSPVKQIWKDFSSGKGGTAITFLMEHEHFTYPEAIKYLANKYNIEVEETEQTDEQKIESDEKESLYLVSDYANKFFQKSLKETDEGKSVGLSYFKERGFAKETINKFQLGYCKDEWTSFTDQAIKDSYKIEFLEKSGLTIVKEEKKFDRFKGRVIFPILSMSGRVLGFGGRTLKTSKSTAKYLNSPESKIYYKSKVLYGLFHAKQEIAKQDNCFLVEGYTDVMRMHERGIRNVVSSSGTALSSDQIRLINRLTNNITVVFDGDSAGINAAFRGIDIILEQGMNVKICNLPEGEDPDSFAKDKNVDELSSYFLENSKDFITYKASLLIEGAKNDPIKKAETIRDMVASISKISDQIKKEIYIKECSSIMDISEEVLYSTLAQISKKQISKLNKPTPNQEDSFKVVKNKNEEKSINVLYELEKKIIEILILYGDKTENFEDLLLKENDAGELVLEPVVKTSKVFEKIYMDLQEDEMEFSNDDFKNIYYIIIENLNKGSNITVEMFANKVPVNIELEITNILMGEEKYRLHDWQRSNIFPKDKSKTIAQLVNDTILNLRCFLIDQKVNEFKNKTLDSDDNKSILDEVLNYSNLKMLLSRKLKRVI